MPVELPRSVPQKMLIPKTGLDNPPRKNRKNEEQITFVQFSDKLLTPNSIMRDYYRQAYAEMDGYYFPEHYMEIPYWIPTIAGKLSDNKYDKTLHVV